jgi:hypothetical protein
VVGVRVDVEEHRAGNVGGGELGARVALELRHVPGAVDDPHVATREISREPLRRDERQCL